MKILFLDSISVCTGDVPIIFYEIFKNKNIEFKALDYYYDLNIIAQFYCDKTLVEDKRKINEPIWLYFYNKKILKEFFKYKPDILFIFYENWGVWPETLRTIKDNNCKIILWDCDFKHSKWYQSQSFEFYDIIFTLDTGYIDFYKQNNVKNIFYLPAGYYEKFHYKRNLSDEEKKYYESDICFIGYPFDKRVKLFQKLESKFNLKIYGLDWTDRRHLFQNPDIISDKFVYGDAIYKIYSASKICLNLQNLQKNGFSNRIFEATACGCAVLTEYKYDLNSLFLADKEILCFHNENEIFEKLDFYLNNEGELNSITQNALKKLKAEHSYEKRIDFILEKIEKCL